MYRNYLMNGNYYKCQHRHEEGFEKEYVWNIFEVFVEENFIKLQKKSTNVVKIIHESNKAAYTVIHSSD